MTAAETRTDGYDNRFWAAVVGVALIPMELTFALWSDPWVRSHGWVMFASVPLAVAAFAALDHLNLTSYQFDRMWCPECRTEYEIIPGTPTRRLHPREDCLLRQVHDL